jgi:hypothetical protein
MVVKDKAKTFRKTFKTLLIWYGFASSILGPAKAFYKYMVELNITPLRPFDFAYTASLTTGMLFLSALTGLALGLFVYVLLTILAALTALVLQQRSLRDVGQTVIDNRWNLFGHAALPALFSLYFAITDFGWEDTFKSGFPYSTASNFELIIAILGAAVLVPAYVYVVLAVRRFQTSLKARIEAGS